MPAPLEPRRTRVVVIDGQVFLLKWHRDEVVGIRRLEGWESELALRLLDDVQFEIEARVEGAS